MTTCDMSNDTIESLNHLLEEKIALANNLIKILSNLNNIPGVQKLQRKVEQELVFFQKKQKSNLIKKENIQCTNLTHFEAIVELLDSLKSCNCQIEQFFSHGNKKISVDIVCDNGLQWIKVVARNPKALLSAYEGDGSYGVRSIIEIGEEYLECAQHFPVYFQIPEVIFYFAQGLPQDLVTKLKSIGITVILKEDNESNSVSNYIKSNQHDHTSKIDTINLDVTSMIAYVSNLTNGHCNFIFREPLLTQQAEWETKTPVKTLLDSLFSGKKLVCCETALKDFQSILFTVGGPSEQKRGEELISRLTVFPDNYTTENVENRSNHSLALGGRIKERSILIFEFGNRLKALTVSANEGFIRAARQQGVNFTTFLHESRALTERKEAAAEERFNFPGN